MLIVLSPAKTLDYESKVRTRKYTEPTLLEHSQALIDDLRKYSGRRLRSMMSISEDLADLNRQRYQDWQQPFTPENARQAIFAFKGDVYSGFEVENLDSNDMAWAQNHLRILSGLYGLLRPLDLMQPYRLEMGTALKTKRGRNLYEFWDERISKELNEQLSAVRSKSLVNLASNEYFKSIKLSALDATVITPAFKDWNNGDYKMIGFFAKKARGRMASWIIRNRITDAGQLGEFSEDGYRFDKKSSTDEKPVFLRKAD